MSLYYGFEVKDIQVKDIPTDDKDVVNKKYIDDQMSLVKRSLSGKIQATLTGNTYSTESSKHSGWPIGHMINSSKFKIVVDGLIVDNDTSVNPNYDFKVRLFIYDDGGYRNQMDFDLYNSTDSKMIKLLAPPATFFGHAFYRVDKSNPSVEIDLNTRRGLCILFQIKESAGTSGNEIWMDYHIQY